MENKTLKTVNVKTASGAEVIYQELPNWECVIVKGQTFISNVIGDSGIFEVIEVKPAFKFDADVTLLRKSDRNRRQVKASSLCANPLWRRLPDLELDEVYLSEEDDPLSAPTRIGLGPLPDFS